MGQFTLILTPSCIAPSSAKSIQQFFNTSFQHLKFISEFHIIKKEKATYQQTYYRPCPLRFRLFFDSHVKVQI